jgi:hypothetical protein
MAQEVFPDSESDMTPDQFQRYNAALSAALRAGDSDAYYALKNRSILNKKTTELATKPAKAETKDNKSDVKSS